MNAVDQAAFMANELVRRESRGPGDTENAMRRLEARYGIAWRTFWALRYRKPADVMSGIYQRLLAAYDHEIQRQLRLLAHEAEITKIIAGDMHPAVVEAETLVGTKGKGNP